MKTINDLRTIVRNLDGSPFASIKVIQGKYDLEDGKTLNIEKIPKRAHERGRIALTVRNDYPNRIVKFEEGILAVAHFIAKRIYRSLKDIKWFKPYKPSSAVLERNIVNIRPNSITVRINFEVPKKGSKINGKELEYMFIERIPVVATGIMWRHLNKAERINIESLITAIEDQRYLIRKLKEEGNIAFIGNGANPDPERGTKPIEINRNLLTTYELPSGRTVEGLVITSGITSFYGIKYAGKSTILQALTRGFYVYQPGDGREWIKTVDHMPLITSDWGRVIRSVDVSPFIESHPSIEINVEDVRTYSADGYLSQVSSLMEALELRVPGVLIDEELSDPFFVRGKGDTYKSLPQTIVTLADKYGLSFILAVETAEEILRKSYVIYEVKGFSIDRKVKLDEIKTESEDIEVSRPRSRRPPEDFIPAIASYKVGDRKVRIITREKRGYNIAMDRTFRYSIIEKGQLNAIMETMKIVRRYLDGKRSLTSAIRSAMDEIYEKGIASLGFKEYYAEFSEWQLAYMINRISKIR